MLHAIAFAPGDALGGNFMSAPPESAEVAFRTSAYSFKALAEALPPLMDDGGSFVGWTSTPRVAWPVYDWMGVAKAAPGGGVAATWRATWARRGVRVNLVSAGPIETAAAGGIPGFDELAGAVGGAGAARLGRERPGAGGRRRAASCCRTGRAAISGEILHVDGGFHAMGAPLRQ